LCPGSPTKTTLERKRSAARAAMKGNILKIDLRCLGGLLCITILQTQRGGRRTPSWDLTVNP